MAFKRPRGTHDFLPDKMGIRKFVERAIEETFESYGFQQIQTPTYEEFALLSARSGEEIKEGMITFFLEDTEYGLRPEWTAPVCRLIASRELEQTPKPYKLYYIGQCFRYERPQAGRYREFRQAGLELMGSSSPVADAEVMTIAVRVLERLGISAYKLKVGNIGIFRDILAGEGLNYDSQSKIISEIDNRVMSVREKCETIKNRTSFENDDIEYVKREISDLYKLQEEIQYEGEYEIVPQKEFNEPLMREWLDKLPLIAEETQKVAWIQKGELSEGIANLLIEVSKIQGSKDEIADEAKRLIEHTGAKDALNDLLEVLRWLDTYGVKDYEAVLGVARGLDYYTGTVFEIDCPLLGAQKQICGGGRYDKLVEEFGEPQIPATGFAFGFDRVVEAFEKSGGTPVIKKIDIFIATTSEDMNYKAIEIGEMLRREGKRIEIDIMKRDLKEQLGYASTVNCDYTLILGPDELQKDSIMVKDMKTQEQQLVKICELKEKVV